jgi:hypothetical protein
MKLANPVGAFISISGVIKGVPRGIGSPPSRLTP